jgi:transposase
MAPSHVRPRQRRRADSVHKPRGTLNSRVKRVGPEHFGIVAIDCAKHRSKWMFTDFYGTILAPPTVVEHQEPAFRHMVAQINRLREQHQIKDMIVAIERTGVYHKHIRKYLLKDRFEVRTVHPFATKSARLPADPGNKTDDTDLAAIFRAAVNGFALQEPEEDPLYVRMQLLERRRRDLVRENASLRCRIREHLQAYLPGFTNCFDDIFINKIALIIAARFPSAAAIRAAGRAGLEELLTGCGVRYQRRSLTTVLAWAARAPEGDTVPSTHQYILSNMEEERQAKLRQIAGLEAELLTLLVRTPYVLLLAITGVNVVSTAEFAGERGPIANYSNARTITGRSGLYPARYQSDQVDRRDGKLVRSRNRGLRHAILLIADNLMRCNPYFHEMSERWRQAGQDTRAIHVKVADRFCRIAYQVVAGGPAFRHPLCERWDSITDKVINFIIDNELINYETQHGKIIISDIVKQCLIHLPERSRAEEWDRLRGRGAASVSGTTTVRPSAQWTEIVSGLLAEQASSPLEYPTSGESFSEPSNRSRGPHNAVCPQGEKP